MPTIHRYLVHKMTLNRSMSSTGILYFFISQSFIQPGLIWNLKKKPDLRHVNGPTRTSVSAKSNVVSDMIWAASTWKSQMDFKICGKVYCASVLNALEFMINSKRVWRINLAETLLSSLQGYRNILAKTFSAQTDQVRNLSLRWNKTIDCSHVKLCSSHFSETCLHLQLGLLPVKILRV